MATPDAALRRLLRDIGKLLQPYGFEGSEPSWVWVEEGGVAVVGRTRALRSWTDGQQVLRFGLSLRVTPTAWWEFGNWRAAQVGRAPSPLEAATGPDLIADGLPESMTELWSLRTEPDQPGQVHSGDVEAIRAELPRRVHAYARRARQLLEPDRYLDELLAQPDRQVATWEAITVLLAERGPTPELDDALDQLRALAPSNHADEVLAYARSRAAVA
ncbi:hypothetical protein V7968_20190 [Nocardia vulneris]|uniref:hypothetical protein n=1 Tax=Nocardia vulneris TaxID=1141657 RepID=UPI0030CD583C